MVDVRCRWQHLTGTGRMDEGGIVAFVRNLAIGQVHLGHSGHGPVERLT
jgi:hypothetical protein